MEKSEIENRKSKIGITAPRGFRATGVACGLKKTGALDLALVVSDRDCACAGMFTTNRVQAAPVVYDRATLAQNNRAIRAVIVNSGCANACTGDDGLADTRVTADETARALGVRAEQVLVMSTGVIGQRLPMEKIRAGIAQAAPRVLPEGGADASRAIMTTDTRPKVFAICNSQFAIGGMCKGAGMIHPNMATMLSVITTDAKIAPELLDRALRVAVNQSFNCISIDGDMSTNDTVLLLANGASGTEIGELEIGDFTAVLTQVCTNLAQQLVRDGEGVTKFVEIVVSGAREESEAVRVAKSIANSPLVKTALYGGDANWGRVVCAAGYSGVAVEPAKMKLWFGDVNVFANGMPTNFDEADSTRALSGKDVFIRLDLGTGSAQTKVWTCDLSHDYVTINGKYRT
ncbi:MAG: bifunctional glutamate N-acetyltransferase/amino-acid acetyltransferase ArgJ [Chloroflexi bacterium]|nr:bifunctional glutamate N-acetyltransferase/amino-acid acetyltransferase ArgJ [Chloroflexota bacterium]